MGFAAIILLIAGPGVEAIGPGDHTRTLMFDGRERTYLVHVPPGYERSRPAPVVLVFHGAGTNGAMTVRFTGLNEKGDAAGFITVYPDGTGAGPFLTWNAGGRQGLMAERAPDDVGFTRALLDDLEAVVAVDRRRVYATGMSNGGMMCYRLAAELSDRIAAIAPVAGTMAIAEARPERAVPVIHFHGTEDRLVPFGGPGEGTPRFLTFQSVEATIAAWRRLNGCDDAGVTEAMADRVADGTTVTRTQYHGGSVGAEVVLYRIEGGGHTWPGQPGPAKFLGRTTEDVSANDLIWSFFETHPMP